VDDTTTPAPSTSGTTTKVGPCEHSGCTRPGCLATPFGDFCAPHLDDAEQRAIDQLAEQGHKVCENLDGCWPHAATEQRGDAWYCVDHDLG
jgi:hypothetical protein